MSQRTTITVDNLKCGGCSATITKRLSALEGVTDVQIDSESEQVSFSSPLYAVELARQTLEALGYPERGTAAGLANLGAKARSLVSCAIGKVGGSSIQRSTLQIFVVSSLVLSATGLAACSANPRNTPQKLLSGTAVRWPGWRGHGHR